MDMKSIEVSDDTNSYNLEVEDNVNLETIQSYFEGAKGLLYTKKDNENPCMVPINNNYLELPSNVTKFFVCYGNATNDQSFKRKHDNSIMEIIKRNKIKQNKLKANTKEREPVVFMKDINIGWKHFEGGKFNLKKGGEKKVQININGNYTYNQVIDLCTDALKDNYNDNYFNKGMSTVQLGKYSEILTSMPNGDFPKFIQNFKMKNNQYRIYVYTRPKAALCDITSKHTNQKSPANAQSTKTSNQYSIDKIEEISKVTDYEQENSRKSIFDKSSSTVNASKDEDMELDPRFVPLQEMRSHVPEVDKNEISFITGSLLGQGGFGTVSKAIWRHTPVAVKTIRIAFNCKYACREIGIMDKIRHPNIISIMAYAKDFSYCYVIMELFNSHNMREVIFDKKVANMFALSDLNRYHIAGQICIAVAFLHELEPQIVHKDLKPENILIDNNLTVKLCDLGFSRLKEMPASLLTTDGCRPKGTVLYMSPEILLDNESGTPASDVWALGGVIKELFTGELIWPNVYENEIVNCMKLGQKPNLKKVPLYLTDILNRCFNYSTIHRPMSSEVLLVINNYLVMDSL